MLLEKRNKVLAPFLQTLIVKEWGKSTRLRKKKRYRKDAHKAF